MRRAPILAVFVCVVGALVVGSGGAAATRTAHPASAIVGTWQPSTTLFSASSPDDEITAVDGPSVAADGRGRATAVWLYSSAPVDEHDTPPPESVIMEADRSASGGWTRARALTALGTDIDHPPSLAVDARGDAVLAWDDGEEQVRAAYRPAGHSWQAVRTLSPPGVRAWGGTPDDPQVALDDRGRALVAWTDEDASGVFRLEVDARGGSGLWGKAKTICTCGTFFSMAMNRRGQARVVWSPNLAEGDGGFWSESRAPSGQWSAPQEVSPLGTADSAISLVINSHGAALVGWIPDKTRMLTVALAPPSRRFESAQEIGGDAYWGFSVGLAPTGEAVLMSTNYKCCLFTFARSPNARSFTREQLLDFGEWTTIAGPLGMDARGDTLALWARTDDAQELHVHAAQRPAGGTFDSGSDLADAGPDSYKHAVCGAPSAIAMEPSGDAVAVWLARPKTLSSTGAPFLCSMVEAATFER